jgi:hypothetical protein
MTIGQETSPYRTTARVVGVVYLAGFVVGISGNAIIQSVLGVPNYLSTLSASSTTVAIGAVLWLMAAAGDTAHGILMLPILRQRSERMAYGYLGTRIIDAAFIALMVLFILLQIPLAGEYLKATAPVALSLQALSTVLLSARLYAYEIGMSALGFAGVMLCYTLYKAKLVPRWLAVWGIVGYAIILCGMVSAIMGSGLGDLSAIPGGLWEVFVGVWLIAKGFNPAGFVSEQAGADAG